MKSVLGCKLGANWKKCKFEAPALLGPKPIFPPNKWKRMPPLLKQIIVFMTDRKNM